MDEKKTAIQGEINALEMLLASLDFNTIKYVEGALAEEKFDAIKTTKAEMRARINELEEQLDNLDD